MTCGMVDMVEISGGNGEGLGKSICRSLDRQFQKLGHSNTLTNLRNARLAVG